MGLRTPPVIGLPSVIGLPLIVVLVALAGACRTSEARPGRGEELRQEGIAALQGGEKIAAARLFREALAENPTDSVAYGYLADTFREGGWADDGYRYFRNAVASRAGKPPELRYYLAFYAAYTGKLDSASLWLRQARAVRAPTFAEAVALADMYLLYRKLDTAIALLGEAAGGHRDRPEARRRLIVALTYAGRTADARAHLDTLVHDFPDRPATLATLAQFRYVTGDLEGAEQATKQWLALAPMSPEARWNVARLLMRRGDWKSVDHAISEVVATRR